MGLKFSQSIQHLLRCPVCQSELDQNNEQSCCTNVDCSTQFPVVRDIPILIDENKSVFSPHEYLNDPFSENVPSRNKLKETLDELLPGISKNLKAKENFVKFTELLLERSPAPRVLVVGGRVLGEGMASLASCESIELLESDVAFGPRTQLIFDAHDIPFADGSFDGVVIQAVLEHVLDPYRCVREVHRVLKSQGLIYAETPFMQQVHGGAHDFTRFTHLGHRRLFRHFDELDSGPVGGPGMGLAWSYQYFLLSFGTSRKARMLLRTFARLTSFYLKYFDAYLIKKLGSYDAASGFYFLGEKNSQPLLDGELISLYKGLF